MEILSVMNNTRLEVLSPAGSRDALEAAVRSGADAVYLGREQFSARRNAENFSLPALSEAVKYCHIRGVKVYLTLNILLREEELSDALEIVKEAAALGIDGVIVADLGLCELIHKTIPTLPLHASTQMTVHSPAALMPLKRLGISRVVVARELSLEAIKEICLAASGLDMSVEVFVHGALCMSVSGQCLLSALLGSRSGNRGLCAGPCRLPFSVEGGNGYDLSLKDLSYFSHIDDLKNASVMSLKIEGRMKRPEYVAAATAACRVAVDNGFVPQELSASLRDVFSRSGFTDGYLTEKLGKDMFGIRTKEDVVSANSAFPMLHTLYRNERQSVPINIKAIIKSSSASTLTVSDGVDTVTVEGNIPDTARSKPTDKAAVASNLSKLGGTPYYLNNLDIHIDDNLYVSASELNSIRRTAIEKLNNRRADRVKYDILEFEFEQRIKFHSRSPRLIARFDSADQIPDNLDGIDGIMLRLEAEPPEPLPNNIKLIVDVPRGILSEEYIRGRLEHFYKKGFRYAYCGNIAAVNICKVLGFEIIGGLGLNVTNSNTAEVLKDLGASAVTLSPELLLSDAVRLDTSIEKGIFAYGRLPLMLMRNCPVKNGSDCKTCNRNGHITDRLGISFPIKCRVGFSELYNSLPIWLADRLDECCGLDFLLLYFTDEPKEDVSTIINAYKNGLSADRKYTRGLYYRSVL